MKIKFKMKENSHIGQLVTKDFYFPGKKVMPSPTFRFGSQKDYFPGILLPLSKDDVDGWCSVRFGGKVKQQSYGIGKDDNTEEIAYDLIYAE